MLASFSKNQGGRFSVIFGPRGPSTVPGAVKNRLGMKSRTQGKGRDFQGPRVEKISTSDVWGCIQVSRTFALPKYSRADH